MYLFILSLYPVFKMTIGISRVFSDKALLCSGVCHKCRGSPVSFSEKERRAVMTQPSTRILIIGAGYAGLLFTMRLARKVARQHVQISLVNESDTFTERVRLHQFATNQGVQLRSIPR